MSQAKIELLVEQLKMARYQTLKLADEIPEDRRLYQLKEGKATPLWLMGHLANTLNTICIMWMFNEESMIGKENVRLFAPDFARGTPPSTDASMYPAWDEVKALYKDAMTAVIQRVEQLTDDQLPNPMSDKTPEPLRAYFSSIGASLNIMVSHDAHHRGQMALIAKL
ncbi:MAG: DinB family protein [Candidatus Hydrogenedentes bacterium]|nr:DinB family protein [Candidatus Hydrogenedentota bacterium]